MKMNKAQTFLFYLLSFTWGIIPSLVGLIIILIMLPFGRVHRFQNRFYAVIGKAWGGLNLGPFFVCGECCQFYRTKAHESGHGFQNIIWGPLYIFVIAIPSGIRYWYRHFFPNRSTTDYDSIWFEGQATRWGMAVYPKEENR